MAKMPAGLTRLNRECVVTVTVHITRRLRLRMAVAKYFMLLAARVLGCKIEVKDTNG